MNLWVINQFAASGNYSTGAGERHFFLAKEYLKDNIDTTIFSGSYSHLFYKHPKFKGRGKIELEEEIRFFWIKVPKYNPSSGLGRLLSWFWFLVNLFIVDKSKIPKPDVIIVSSMTMFPILYALGYKVWNRRVRVIFEVRDIWPLTLLEMSKISKYNPIVLLMKFIERFAYRNSDIVTSVLPLAYEHINDVANKEVKFEYIPNGIHVNYAEHNKIPDRISHLFPKNKFIITYAGAIGPANAMEHFAEAVKGLENSEKYHINIIGNGPDKPAIQSQLSKLKNVNFVDRIKKDEVHAYLKSSDLLYIGWRNKSIYKFGVSANKYNDYMLAAKPILSSSSFPDDPVIEASCGHIVAAELPEAIRDGIEYVAGLSSKQRDILGENGFKYLMEKRQYSVLAKQYLNCFNL